MKFKNYLIFVEFRNYAGIPVLQPHVGICLLRGVKTIGQSLTSLIIVLSLSIGCHSKMEPPSSPLLISNQTSPVIKSLVYKDYMLSVKTDLSNDTLNVDDYKRNKYSSPLILTQKLSFFNAKKLVKIHLLPIKKVDVQTTEKKTVKIMRTPLYEMCLLRASGREYFVVNGAEYDSCNGKNCLEFVGIYSMTGVIIYEGYSGEKNDKSFKKISETYNIKLKDFERCLRIDDFYNDKN